MSKNAKRRLSALQALAATEAKQQEAQRRKELAGLKLLAGDGALDTLVHDLKSREASAINNDGVGSQIDFIVESCGQEEAIRVIKEAI